MTSRAPLPFDPIAEAARLWERELGPADDMAVVTSIMRVQQLLQAAVDATLKPRGLTFARFEALTLLMFSRSGALPMAKMGERLMIHPTSVTNIVDKLEQGRLVQRTPHPTDRRTTLVRLTPAGRRVARAAAADLTRDRFGLPTGTDPGAVHALTALLREIRAGAEDFAPDD
ncbi:MAG: MarR family transcriptional regulator [Mycobacteriales bacterium]